MTDKPLALNVRVQTEGAHERVAVWIGGQHVGALTVGPGQGEAIRALLMRDSGGAPALVKDFHVLYRVTEQLVADIDAEKVLDIDPVKAELRRLLPAFEECEAVRVSGRKTKEGN